MSDLKKTLQDMNYTKEEIQCIIKGEPTPGHLKYLQEEEETAESLEEWGMIAQAPKI